MRFAPFVMATLSLCACDDKKSASPVVAPSASVTAVATARATVTISPPATASPEGAATEAHANVALPSEDDYWEAAEREVTKENMDAELSRIEKEIAAPN